MPHYWTTIEDLCGVKYGVVARIIAEEKYFDITREPRKVSLALAVSSARILSDMGVRSLLNEDELGGF